jgi:hypothetical protein
VEQRPGQDARADPPNDATKWLLRNSLNHDIVSRALVQHKPLCVSVKVDRALESELARKYELKELPTVAVLSPDGEVLASQSGRVGPAQVQSMLASTATGPAEER